MTLPLWWSRELPGQPRLVRQARSWVAGLLPACAPLEDLLIFTSELASNAVTHTRSGPPGGRFTVEVTWSPDFARVVVGDQGSDEVPVSFASAGGQGAYRESGRGLLLIGAMAAAWGIAGDAEGRWLWADVDWRSQDGLPLATSESNNPAEMQLAALRCAYPGISAWYGQKSRHWHAALPTAQDAGDTISAPSPTALTRMLAARHATAASGTS